MVYAIPLLAILFFFAANYKYKTIFNPFSVFNILWLFVGILLCVGNERVYEPSVLACGIIISGIVAFNFASWSPKLVIIKSKPKSHEWVINGKALFILTVIIAALTLATAAASISDLINNTSYSIIRENYYANEGENSNFIYYLRNYFINPMTYSLIVGTVMSFFSEKNVRKLQLVLLLAVVVVQALISGGRYILMNTFFAFVCGFFLFKKEYKMRFTRKIIIAILVAALFYGIIFLTNERATFASRDMTVFQRLYLTIYEYFAGSVTYMDKVIETYPFVVGSTFGINFAAGFITPIFVLFTFLHLITWPEIFNTIGRYACAVLQIGNGTYYNAMPTVFGYFYIDGGFPLLIIEAWLFGYICKRLFARAKEGNLYYTAVFILMFIQICISSTRWFWYSAEFSMAVLYMRLLLTNTRQLEEQSI